MIFKFGELLGSHCSFSIIYGQFSCSSCRGIVERHMHCAQSLVHLVEFAALSGSRLFNELQKQKLINNNYCLQKHYL